MHHKRCGKIVGLAALMMSLAAVAHPTSLSSQATKTQGKPQHPAHTVLNLYKTETVDFPSPGPTDVASVIKCGPNGEIYAVYSSGSGNIWSRPVAGVSVSDRSVTEYRIPNIPGYPRRQRASFDVRADGTLYALEQASAKSGGEWRQSYFIIRYNHDGSVDSRTRVGAEPRMRLQPLHMAAFADGDFLLSGTTSLTQKEIAEGAPMKTFAGVFGRDANFMATLKLMQPTRPPNPSPSGGTPPPRKVALSPGSETAKEDASATSVASNTLSVSAPDGNIYILQGVYLPRIYAVSTTGKIVREVRLRPPAMGLRPVQMAGAGSGHLFIYFSHVGFDMPTNAAPEPDMISVLNTETGRVTAVYRVPPAQEGFAVPACAASPDDFLFLGAGKDNQLAVFRYAAR